MVSEVVLFRNRSAAGVYMPGDGDRREDKRKEAEERDGEEELHAT
jgi:hypothetical protein